MDGEGQLERGVLAGTERDVRRLGRLGRRDVADRDQVAQLRRQHGARRRPRDQRLHRRVRCEPNLDVLGRRPAVEFGGDGGHALRAGPEADGADDGHVQHVRLARVQVFQRERRVVGAEPHAVLVHFLEVGAVVDAVLPFELALVARRMHKLLVKRRRQIFELSSGTFVSYRPSLDFSREISAQSSLLPERVPDETSSQYLHSPRSGTDEIE